jgi:D-aminopeptidase
VRLRADWVSLPHVSALLQAAAEATAEAILNAMLQAETMTGRDGVTVHALDGEKLVEVLARYGRRTFRP